MLQRKTFSLSLVIALSWMTRAALAQSPLDPGPSAGDVSADPSPPELPATESDALPATAASCDGCYLERDGSFRAAAPAYAALHDTGEPRRLRAAIALAGLLGVGSLWYWIDDRNIADWDEPSLKQRFTGEAWRMDNNTFPMNFAYHALSGSAYYAVSRASHLGVWESASYSFLTSFFWEYVLEFKEKISINDVMVTPGAGITLGEFAHKLAWYLNSSPRPTATRRAVAWALGPSVSLARAMDRSPPPATSTDALGYSSDIWHAFELDYSVASAALNDGARDTVHQYGFRGTLVSIPGFLRPGTFRRWFYQADVSSLELAIEHSPRGGGIRLLSDTALAGYIVQDMGHAPRPHGVTSVVAAYLAYRYTTSNAHFDERMAVLHFPGPGFDLHARAPGVSVHLLGRAHLDFAGLGPLAYPAWKVAHPEAREKSILRKQDYYFGWGASARAAARLSVGPLSASTEVFYGRYDSAEGLDRTQDKVTADVNATDAVTEQTTRLELTPPRSPLTVGGFVANRRWSSHVGAESKRADVSSAGLRLRLNF